ncbi:MAG: hypothetical protein KR126chlam1_00846 [Chlamydiae bacterium]|nr:hypothetical protein [Chlamydiota bacterium]
MDIQQQNRLSSKAPFKKSLFFVLFLIGTLLAPDQTHADECYSCDPCCEDMLCIDSLYLTLRHIDPRGIGYDKGYTTLEALYFPCLDNACFHPFIDVRGHVFNDNEYAANAGVGVRYLPDPCCNWVYGVNVFYDYRSDHDRKLHFHQMGVGIEVLNDCCFDIRVNGYFPITTQKLVQRCTFDDFDGDFFMERKRYQNAFIGGNLEVGVPICTCWCWLDFYVAGGPYYYERDCEDTFGGQVRLDAYICGCFRLGAMVSHDRLFNTRVQGVISYTFPLGGTCVNDCGQCNVIRQVHRNEIIVLDEFCNWDWNF